MAPKANAGAPVPNSDNDLAEFVQNDHDVLEQLFRVHEAEDSKAKAIELLSLGAKSSGASAALEGKTAKEALADVVVAMAASAAEKKRLSPGEKFRSAVHAVELVQKMKYNHDAEEELLTDHAEGWEDLHHARYSQRLHVFEKHKPAQKAAETTALLDHMEGGRPRADIHRSRLDMSSVNTKDNALVFAFGVVVTLGGVAYAAYLGYNFPQMVKFMSFWVLISRGSAMSLVLLTAFLIMFMCRSTLTRLQATKVGRWWLVVLILDRRTQLHMACGHMLTIFTLLHVIGHLMGSLPAMIGAKSLDEINAATTGVGTVTYNPMSWGDTMEMRPAWTGICLVILLVCFVLLSLPRVRKSSYRVFMIAHELMIPLWLFMLGFHGSRMWLGIGIPLAVPICGIPFLLYSYDRVGRWFATKHEMTNCIIKSKFLHIEIAEEVSYQVGQYALVQVPAINYEWHPFTICSSPLSGHASFLIAVAGDWTKELHARVKMGERPPVCFRGGYLAPAQGMNVTKYMITVGSGVGITPFRSALQEMMLASRTVLGGTGIVRHVVRAKFIWITREPEDFVWANEYVQWLKTSDMRDFVDVNLVLTRKLDPEQDLERKIFWGATRSIFESKAKGYEELKDSIGVPTMFGRPKFDEVFRSFGKEIPAGEEVNVYICGNPMMTKSVGDACVKVTGEGSVGFVAHAESF